MTKEERNEKLAYALAALRAAENDGQRNRLLIRRAMERDLHCSPSTAYRIVTQAAKILAGERVAEWGGLREGAGRPVKHKSE